MDTATTQNIWTLIAWVTIIFLGFVIKRIYLPHGFSPQGPLWRFVKVTFYAAVPIPGLWFIIFYSFVLRARIALGQWPRPYHPDPSRLGFSLHDYSVFLCFILASLSLVLMVLLLPHLRNMSMLGVHVKKYYSIYLITYVLLWINYCIDPGSFIEWYFD